MPILEIETHYNMHIKTILGMILENKLLCDPSLKLKVSNATG